MNVPQKKSVSVAESCTGGLLASAFTKEAGASDYFLGGVVAYSNHLKSTLLDVPEDMLEQHGAVSPEVAQEMAESIMRISGSDIGLSTTGIAGPGGGSSQKPVGLVYIGIATLTHTEVSECRFSGDRQAVQQQAVEYAMALYEAKL